MAGSTWEYERPFTVPLKLIAKSKGGARHVMLQDDEGNNYDCVQGDLRGPHRMTRRSEASSSCNDCAEDGPGRKRQRSRLPNERGVGWYEPMPESSELKTVDHWPTDEITIQATPFQLALNALKVGPNFYERIGNKIIMKDLEIWYRIQLNDDGDGRRDVVRLLVFYDRDPSNNAGVGRFPNTAVLIQSVSPTSTTRSTSEDNINPAQTQRFLILKDYKIFLSNDSVTSGADNGSICAVDRSAKIADRFVINLNGLVSRFRPHEGLEANPGIEQITAGSLVLFVMGLHPADQGWNFHYTARLRYYDP